MSEIEIPFNDWSTERHEQGVKTATTRTEIYGEPGDTFTDAGKRFEITHVAHTRLEVVFKSFWNYEGAEWPREFREVWEENHPREGYDPDRDVWLHLYREIKQ